MKKKRGETKDTTGALGQVNREKSNVNKLQEYVSMTRVSLEKYEGDRFA